MSAAPSVPTFLFTDIEGSTQRWERDRGAMQAALEQHDQLLRQAIEGCGGHVFKTVGDAFCAVFPQANQALEAAVTAQRAVFTADWSMLGSSDEGLRLRMGLHSGSAIERDGDYFGPTVNRCARIEAAANGGQVLLSNATVAALGNAAGHLGLGLRDLGEHRLKDLRHSERLVQVLIEGLPDVTRGLRTAGELEARDRIVVIDPLVAEEGDHAPLDLERGVAETQAEMLRVLRGQMRSLVLTPAQLRALARNDPGDWEAYRLGRVAEWSQPQFRVDGRFVGLTLLVDKGEEAVMGRWQPSGKTFSDLGQLLDEAEGPAIVLLGPPGSGKSTLLRRFELDRAIEALRGDREEERLTFFVSLGQYEGQEPLAWLAERWRQRSPRLPGLSELLASGRITLLLDALNEMPAADEAEMATWTRRWRLWLQELAAGGNRAIFSCRSLDYSQPLSTPSLRVPQVQIEPLGDDQIQDFLRLHSPAHWREIWRAIEGGRQLGLLRSPYFLALMVAQVESSGEIPLGRAALFCGFVRQALRREIERGNPLLSSGPLLDARDRRRIAQWRWEHDHDLPERGPLLPKLARLAFSMQASRPDGERAQARLDLDEALAVLDSPLGEAIVQAGSALALLDEDLVTDELMFVHQLVQEHLAARVLARSPDPERAAQTWREGEVAPSIGQILAQIAPADPLPPLPSTGWEETSLLAADMADDGASYIEGLLASNLVLAGRAAAQPSLRARLPEALVQRLGQALVQRSRDPAADLRARIAAGLALGALGDPRLPPGQGPGGSCLLPEMRSFAGGRYRMGLDQDIVFVGGRTAAHRPSFELELRPFRLACRPVTNAEWAHFIAGGGYDEARYWVGAAAAAWRSGESTADATRSGQRYWLGRFRTEEGLLDLLLRQGTLRPADHERWLQRLAMSPEQLESHLRETYPGSRHRAPRTWNDPRYNQAAQPVVGICWYEAQAYCCWIAEQSGQPFRLPTEAEWELAARGSQGRAFAYGDSFDPRCVNTHETHLRGTAPVGVFPLGDSAEGLQDLTGNVMEWTSSAYGQEREQPAFAYPYRADDGREDLELPDDVLRVCRGGAWASVAATAHAAFRGPLAPGERINQCGFRLAGDLVTESGQPDGLAP